MLRQRRQSSVSNNKSSTYLDNEGKAMVAQPWPMHLIYLHSMAWIAAAIFVIHYGELLDVVANDSRVIRPAFYFGLFCSLSLLGIIGYIAFYAPFIENILVDDVAEKRPSAIYAGIFTSAGAWISYNVALWPIWGFVTPFLVSIIGMALISMTNFFPSF